MEGAFPGAGRQPQPPAQADRTVPVVRRLAGVGDHAPDEVVRGRQIAQGAGDQARKAAEAEADHLHQDGAALPGAP